MIPVGHGGHGGRLFETVLYLVPLVLFAAYLVGYGLQQRRDPARRECLLRARDPEAQRSLDEILDGRR